MGGSSAYFIDQNLKIKYRDFKILQAAKIITDWYIKHSIQFNFKIYSTQLIYNNHLNT